MQTCDVALVGAGPSNLSLAAHLEGDPGLDWALLERRAEPRWHEGMLLPDARLQSSHFKDLVFMSDPGSPFTFFSYLHEHGLLYRYIHAEYSTPLRRDFDRYLQWVLLKLGERVSLGEAALGLHYENGRLVLSTDRRTLAARDVVLGMGHTPRIPRTSLDPSDERVFHSSRYRERRRDLGDLRGRSIAIVGGGQSAAEILLDLVSDDDMPRRLTWLSRGLAFRMFDETVLCNDIYTPEFARYFFGSPAPVRARLNETYKSSSDGIVADLMLSIFRRFYVLDREGASHPERRILLGRTMQDLADAGTGEVEITCEDATTGRAERITADIVVLATGYETGFGALEPALDTLAQRDAQGALVFERDYTLRLRPGIEGVRIFAQNASVDTYGWVDPNLGGTSYRSATIANVLLGRDRYRNGGSATFVDWGGDA
ncbi:SidA/IucD/PvdA family monooxygenase [Salinarimonas ramus]|uniref:L-lysine 6-monooxygenase n=1 Tax=Salinarimonas ramus TaxID=690164 RepID=A0A917Q6N5_9HYPH|nr:SidA/IucD/PvdA family monooxygenase [Salinarimonas ramus]GGK32484.1 L-lysine 6-monooxygenase [Salinarimonas ramus]